MQKIIHLDMDAFYASVEQRDDPSLRGRPLVVGGSPKGRGVVAAASYEARAYGVRSAMPSAEALRRCPDLVFVRPDMAKYKAVSRQMRAILDDYADVVEPLALDECYLDVTADKAGVGTAVAAAQQIRARIRQSLSLTASAGVASQKFVAKIASDWNKPDGLTVVPPDQVLAFIRPLAVERLWGVGPKTAQRLHALGARSIGELADLPRAVVVDALGKHGTFLHRLAHGQDPRRVSARRRRKSFGSEHTFSDDLRGREAVLEAAGAQAERSVGALRRAGRVARTVVLKVRYRDFETVTRSHTLPQATDDLETVMGAVVRMLDRTEASRRPVRLVGVSLSGLAARQVVGRQLELPLGGGRGRRG